jgi:hypothetical protein
MLHAFEIEQLSQASAAYRESASAKEGVYVAPRVERAVDHAIAQVPTYSRFADAGKAVVRAIHGVRDLVGEDPGTIEYYLGRCGRSARNVFGRFESHRNNAKRLHTGGVVVCACATSDSILWEGAAVKILQRLRDRGRLCVNNVLCHGGGGRTDLEMSVIYLTWGVQRPMEITLARRADIEVIAREVSAELGGDLTKDSLVRSLDPITRPKKEVHPASWKRLHERRENASSVAGYTSLLGGRGRTSLLSGS